MAPERTGQGLVTKRTQLVKENGAAVTKASSILEDFLEIKIKEELDIKDAKSEEAEEGDIIYPVKGGRGSKPEELEYEEADVGEVVYPNKRRRVPKREEISYKEFVEGEGAYSEKRTRGLRREEDQDLTSLSWLQSNNLLKSKPLKLPEQRKKAQHEESPTSDLTEETESESSTSQSHSSRASPPPVLMDGPSVSVVEETRTEKYSGRHYSSKDKHHYSVPYDPQLHVTSKPPYSFSCLIFMAIEDSHARALPVKEIYSWITDHFPYFNQAPTGWKNSVRHNLSLNKCFRKVDKAPNLGKGSLWIVDPQYRPNLLNALSKAPYHPCASLDRSPKAPILPPVTLTPQQQDFIHVKTQSRLPNPELFPYLSKRLAASEVDRMNETEETDEDSLDDVDAATAMLELKHGQRQQQGKQWRKKPKTADEELKLLISTSPSEDHTYSVDRVANYKQRQPVSPDEAYGGGSDSNDDNSGFVDENEELSWSSDGAEQRNVASALLHLAGGSRKRSAANHDSPSKSTPRGKRVSQRQPILQRTLKKTYRGSLNNNNSSDKYSGRVSYRPKMADFTVYGSSR